MQANWNRAVSSPGWLLPWSRVRRTVRLKWAQSLGWWKVSCMLRGLAPNAQEGKKFPTDARRRFEKVAGNEALKRLHGLAPAQPSDKSRAWGVNSFAVSPVFGGMFREDVAQQCGFACRFRRPRERATIRDRGWR